MAFVRVQGTQIGNTGADTTIVLTLGSAVGSGNSVVGCGSCDSGSGNVSSIADDKSNTYTVVSNINDATQGQRLFTFALGNITNAPTVITITLNGSVPFRSALCDEFSGTEAAANNRDGGTGQNQAAPGTGTDAITSTAITTTVAGDLIWGVAVRFNNTTLPTAGTGFANAGSENTFEAIRSEFLTQGAAGSKAATFTQGTADRTTCCIIAIKPAAGTFTWLDMSGESQSFLPGGYKREMVGY